MKAEELNKKLAEWAGFIYSGEIRSLYQRYYGWSYPLPSGEFLDKQNELPNFTQSVDACIKWLVPKLNKPQFTIEYNCSEGNIAVWFYVTDEDDYYDGSGETVAMALCSAIENLIDNRSLVCN